jgi:acyl-[acyl-carrier-protein]-phospholipid O-acyltransferase/long-chain-fatty-acid--[acyl-carrier-protein] ligase
MRFFLLFLVVLFLGTLIDIGQKVTLYHIFSHSSNNVEHPLFHFFFYALILTPFILLFVPAGYVSDKFPKHLVMRYSALSTFIITIASAVAYIQGSFITALALSLLLSVQMVFFSVAKYGYIKELLKTPSLVRGNAYVHMSMITAALIAYVVFSHLINSVIASTPPLRDAILMHSRNIALLFVVLSTLQLIISFWLADHKQKSSARLLSIPSIFKDKALFIPILLLALFWAISQTVMINLYVTLRPLELIMTDKLLTLFVIALGIGVIIGSYLAKRHSKKYIELGSIPVLFGFLSITVTLLVVNTTLSLLTPLLFFYGLFSGVLVVTLNALIQYRSHHNEEAQTIAIAHFIQALLMIIALAITIAIPSSTTLLIGALITLMVTGLLSFYLLPQSFVRFVTQLLLLTHYRLDVTGLEHIPRKGGVLLLGNHISFLDWAVLQLALPRKIRFMLDVDAQTKPFIKWLLRFYKTIPYSSQNPSQALAEARQALLQGEIVVMFPEGFISRTGQLGKLHDGFETLIAHTPQTTVLPFYLRGLWGSSFSFAPKKLKRERFRIRRVQITFNSPLAPNDITVQRLEKQLNKMSIQSWDNHIKRHSTLIDSWLSHAKSHLFAWSLADSEGVYLNNLKLLVATLLFRHKLASSIEKETNVGILLPTSIGGYIVNLALMMLGKTTVNLNFTAGHIALNTAINKASIKTVVTSTRFLTKLKQKGVNLDKVLANVHVIYAEDVKESISKAEKFHTFLTALLFPTLLLKHLYTQKTDGSAPATILFSSGSEGSPKGIVLTHHNILSNIFQIQEIINPRKDDVLMGTLPIFHSFGLSLTMFLPLIKGIPVVVYPDPTDAPTIGQLTDQFNGTILCGTNTFLKLYSKNSKLKPNMFSTVRFVFAGAEKITPEVRQAFANKFDKTIYEGYGTTETAPVASANTPDVAGINHQLQTNHKIGTVGRAIPGTMFAIVDPNTLEPLPTNEAGLIMIAGAQLMQGYLNDSYKTDQSIIMIDGIRWYKTGDKGFVDADGFLTIIDRYARFAKIGGEMISLSAIEEQIQPFLDHEVDILAVNLPHPSKGEHVILLVAGEIDHAKLKKEIIHHLTPLMQPSKIFSVEMIPKLGSGKTNFYEAKEIARKLLG